MIKFEDPENWLELRKAGILKSYTVPNVFDGRGICIDIGSNVGAFAIVHADMFQKIVCYEPAQETYDICVRNTSTIKHVEVHRLAVSDTDGETVKLQKYKSANLSGNASILKRDNWSEDEYELVNTISLASIRDEYDLRNVPNYVKIDTEGSEYNILMGKDLSYINYLSVEIHLQLGSRMVNELKAYLDSQFSVVSLVGGGNTHYEITYKNNNI